MKIRAPNEIDVYVGRRLKLRRVAVGMSQQRLGQAIGVTFQQIQKYEKGLNRISAGKMHMIAQVLGAAPSYFLEGSPQISAASTDASLREKAADIMASPEWVEVKKAISSIQNKKIQQRIMEVVMNFIQVYKINYNAS
jgi:transcriptional regulator with XRE-family HTH domain